MTVDAGAQARARDEALRLVLESDAAPGDLAGVLAPLRVGAGSAVVADADARLVAVLGAVGPHRLTDVDHPEPSPVVLSDRFGQADTLAADVHRDQTRKSTVIPYVAHLLGAASLLLEQPGTSEDQAIAALLHDAVEDQQDRLPLTAIRDRFGDAVARIVADCTDADTEPKPPWPGRKAAYIAHLRTVGRSSLQVSLADKLHNATAILRDRTAVGPVVWDRFTAPATAQHWYYSSLAAVFTDRLGNQLSQTLAWTVAQMCAAGALARAWSPPDAD